MAAERDASDAQEKLRSFWDKRYAEDAFVYGEEPNTFLVAAAAIPERFRPGSRILCLADGEGRNGVWLARQGYQVTSVDISVQGLNKAVQLAARYGVSLKTEQADLASHDLGVACWDGIVSIFLHLPSVLRQQLHQRCMAALVPGGCFIFEAYSPEQLVYGTGGPKEPHLLPTLCDLEQDFAGAHWHHRYSGPRQVCEGQYHNGVGHVVQVVVEKPAVP